MTNLRKKHYYLIIPALAVIFSCFPVSSKGADLAGEIAQRAKQIEDIQKQIDDYERQIEETHSKSATLQNEIQRLNAQIGQLALEIKSLDVNIDRTGLEIQSTKSKIDDAVASISKHRIALAQTLRITYETDKITLTEILLKNESLSDFFNDLNRVQTAQDSLRITIDNIRSLKEDLSQREEELQGKKSDLEQLQRLQEVEKQALGGQKSKKNLVLKETKGQESKFQQLVKKSQLDIERIRSQITYLEQNGISAEDALKYGQLAAIAAGIRPAFLLAILEIESRLGQNVGTGNWSDDMYQCYLRLSKIAKTDTRRQYYIKRAETEKNAFMAIVGKLGLDPNTVKVSREPAYGCGGAMGPAQFLPSIWLSYEQQVSRLTSHAQPSPWNVEDAFTASAIKLAAGGATSKTKAGESGAARAYIGGKTTCSSSICNYYSNAVLRKAADIEGDL